MVEGQARFDFNEPDVAVAAPQSSVKEARSGSFGDNMKQPLHRWFRYSAGFSADWASRVISERRPRQVLDPFCGSGTTLLAADANMTPSVGFESHPFVSRIAAAKLRWDVPVAELDNDARRVLATAREMVAPLGENVSELLLKCFTEDNLKKLTALKAALASMWDELQPNNRELLWLTVTAILRTVSHVGTAQWQYILPNKRKSKSADAFNAFDEKAREICADLVYAQQRWGEPRGRLLRHDARYPSQDIAPGSVDLVVTSPPYPNNYDYADATRLEMTFWEEISGWGDLQQAVRQYIIRSCSQHAAAERLRLDALLSNPAVDAIRDELSAVCTELDVVRQTKGGRKTYHTMVAAYFVDLAKTFQTLRPLCGSEAEMCFVVGDSAPYGVYVPAEIWLGQLAKAAGFDGYRFEKLRDRNVKWKNRKHDVPLHEGRLWIQG
ncbi:TRM11 family methyltransferase [Burkholderia gladioli]|uniref:DNA modification methylase n=1 Tax=Burkholderia gladioli TaxID=28095 RepID=UPI0034DB14FC